MCCGAKPTLYSRFLNASPPSPLTPQQKLLLAWNDVRDPFNLLTIAVEAAFTIGTNPDTHYGPGMQGFAKYAGVSLTQDATGEFFGTFLIPSLAHQDPRYRRMPNAPFRRRLVHVLDAVVVGQGDDGRPMFNYANVLGSIATNSLGNVYVPGRKKGVGATAARISISLATDPIGNSIAEFLPDLARHININVVLVQRVINRVAISQGAGPTE
jgi:hypothetical protein